MPFDTFFASTNKKHYVPVEGVDALYDQLMSHSFEERQAIISGWRDRGFTKVERIVLNKLHFMAQGKRWARVHKDDDKRIDTAIQEIRDGKRIRIVNSNYNTASGACSRSQKHARGRGN